MQKNQEASCSTYVEKSCSAYSYFQKLEIPSKLWQAVPSYGDTGVWEGNPGLSEMSNAGC